MLWPNYRRWASQGYLGVMRSYSYLRASEWAPTQLFLTCNIVRRIGSCTPTIPSLLGCPLVYPSARRRISMTGCPLLI